MLSYGWVYEFLESLYYSGKLPIIHIHRYLIATFFVFSGVFYFITTKRKKTFQSLTQPMNVFVFIVFILNIVVLSSSSARYLKTADNKEDESLTLPSHPIADTFPDIYYIILDGYADDSILLELYNYNNNSLTDYLAKRDFFISSKSRTNYISTAPSLSSSLNLSYLDSSLINKNQKKNIIYSNEVSKYLKQKGYRIIHVRSGFSVSSENNYADTTIALENLNEFERTILRYSIFRLDDLVGYAHYKTLKEQLKEMNGVFFPRGPKFVFLHIVSPHPPFICDENGNFKTSKRVRNIWWEPKEDYLHQLKYINKEVINFISNVFKQSKAEPIIIVQSDHGPWVQSASFKKIYDARSKIINAYHIPYKWKEKLYNEISPVNSFRFIFNGLFNDSLPLLKDIPLDSASVFNNMNSDLLENN